jgi:hypothetical protein
VSLQFANLQATQNIFILGSGFFSQHLRVHYLLFKSTSLVKFSSIFQYLYRVFHFVQLISTNTRSSKEEKKSILLEVPNLLPQWETLKTPSACRKTLG